MLQLMALLMGVMSAFHVLQMNENKRRDIRATEG
jgi:hypothetical protein